MRRKGILLAAFVLTASLLAGCGSKSEPKADSQETGGSSQQTESNDSGDASGSSQEAEKDAGTVSGGLKTGIGAVTTVGSSKDASAGEEGLAQADVLVAAVTVDGDGKIVECVLDTAQTKVGFSAEGKITTDLNSEFKTKNESGDDYGMKAASSIGKEWYEQAEAFAQYCVGKTADEINGIAVNESGAPSDADLAASVTLYVGSFQQAVTKAVNNAADLGAAAGDKLGLGMVTNISNSVDASADAAGEAQPYTSIAAVTVNGDGVITSSTIDAVQAKINFDITGKITTDLKAEIASKNELGDNYGMKAASSIGKEWYEQAAAYAAYAAGKTPEEVNGTEVTEGVPSDADLAASVTLHIAEFNSVIEKAAGNAK